MNASPDPYWTRRDRRQRARRASAFAAALTVGCGTLFAAAWCLAWLMESGL